MDRLVQAPIGQSTSAISHTLFQKNKKKEDA